MAVRLPLHNLKATSNIESRCKLLKRQFHAINEMVNHSSGFGWNDVEKCITASKDVFDDWVKVNSIKLQQLKFPFFFFVYNKLLWFFKDVSMLGYDS